MNVMFAPLEHLKNIGKLSYVSTVLLYCLKLGALIKPRE